LKHFSKYTNKRVQRLTAFAGRMRPPYRVQDIHALRVDIKKLKSVCVLFEDEWNTTSSASTPRMIQHLFRQAGRVRDGHLIRAYLQHRSADDRPRHLLQLAEVQLQKASVGLHRLMRQRKLKAALALLPAMAAGVRSGELVSTIRRKEKKLQRRLQKAGRQPEVLHRLRQKMKTLSYLQAASGQSTDQYKLWMHQAGCWHDAIRLMAILQQWQQDGLVNEKEAPRLEAFKHSLRRKAARHYQWLIKQWPA